MCLSSPHPAASSRPLGRCPRLAGSGCRWKGSGRAAGQHEPGGRGGGWGGGGGGGGGHEPAGLAWYACAGVACSNLIRSWFHHPWEGVLLVGISSGVASEQARVFPEARVFPGAPLPRSRQSSSGHTWNAASCRHNSSRRHADSTTAPTRPSGAEEPILLTSCAPAPPPCYSPSSAQICTDGPGHACSSGVGFRRAAPQRRRQRGGARPPCCAPGLTPRWHR